MVFGKLASLLGLEKRPIGLSIQMGTIKEMLGNGRKTIRGYGPYTRIESTGAKWKKCRKNYQVVPSKEPNPHFVISGMSGFGKSTLFKSMIVDIVSAKVSCIVLDAHDEHEELVLGIGGKIYDSKGSGINLLALDGASVAERIADLSALFKRVYHLGYIQSTKLSECLWYTYRRCGARGRSDRILERDPKVGDLLYEIGVFIGNARGIAEKNSLMHLKDKISNLNISSFNKSATDVNSLRSGLHSFSLSAIKSKEGRLIYIEELLSRIYMVMKDDPKDGKIRQYIVVDEAQFLMNDSEESSGIITKFIEEGRKYGRAL